MNTGGHSSAEWPSASGPGPRTQRTYGTGAHQRNSSSPPASGRGGGSGPPQEWCLHAQLTISHPKAEPVQTTYVARGIGGSGSTLPRDKWTTTGSNIQFQYSWSNCDKETVTEVVPEESGIQKFESWPRGQKIGGFQQQQQGKGRGQNGKKVGDSGYSTEQNFGGAGATGFQRQEPASFKARVIQPYGRRCISTCTITLSNDPAVTGSNLFGGTESGGLGVGSKYSFSSENLSNFQTFQTVPPPPPPPPVARIVVKDAETQTVPSPPVKSPPPPFVPQKSGILHTRNDFTSITVNPDTSNVTVLNNQTRKESPPIRGHHKDSFRSVQIKGYSPPQVEQRSNHHSSRTSFRTPIKENGSAVVRRAKSSPPIRYQQKTNQPRTVHIDVYCTGSSADETGTTATTTTDDDNHSSASTPQTVYNTTQYKIQHQRHKSGFPQHYQPCGQDEQKTKITSPIPPATPPKRDVNRDDTLNNLTCSKNKNFLEEPDDFMILRKNLSRESCETGSVMSSTYPSSYHSEVKEERLSRDSTASSFSFASGHGYEQQSESSWKESKTTGGSVMSASYHFDGKRVEEADRHSDLEESLLVGTGEEGGVNDQWWLQYLFSKFDAKDEADNVSALGGSGGGSSTNLLNMKRLSYPTYNLHENEEKMVLPPFMECPEVSLSRLDTATKFGEVVRGLRKPGHHIPGPTKNPNCPCDHCRSHFEMRGEIAKEQQKQRKLEEEESRIWEEMEGNRVAMVGAGRARALSLGQIDGHSVVGSGGSARVWRRRQQQLTNNLNISSDKFKYEV